MNTLETPPALAQALALHQEGQLEPACAAYRAALARDTRLADAWHLWGVVCAQQGRARHAKRLIARALALQPQSALFQANHANVLRQLGDPEAALRGYARALALQPDFADALANRTLTLWELHRFEEALASADALLQQHPDHAQGHNLRGMAQKALGLLDAALLSYASALQRQPAYAQAAHNRAQALLLAGDWLEGWPLLEQRWELPELQPRRPRFPQPLWLGNADPAGKRVLLHAEQGMGDTVQFIRYAPLLAQRGAHVLAHVQASLLPLLRCVPGVHTWLHPGQTLPPFDWHCPLMSLPLAFRTVVTGVPLARAYLHSDPERRARWRALLGPRLRPRVGLVARGNAAHSNDRLRSLPLSALLETVPPSWEPVVLQKELSASDAATLAQRPQVRHLGPQLHDFADTAAACDVLDLVISVDTSVAHVSAALGRATWILLPHVPDWRWLQQRTDSPWYSSARLWRQGPERDWAPVLHAVGRALCGAG